MTVRRLERRRGPAAARTAVADDRCELREIYRDMAEAPTGDRGGHI
ncbi:MULTISPECIES: hypothetical protein [Streptomyces]|nr:hypothetical protein [Streptomyces sp. NEAU-383]